MEMEFIPALSLMKSKPVIVEDGEYRPYIKDGSELDLQDILNELTGYDALYFLDLDGIEFDRPQTEPIRKMSTRKKVWVDIGARNSKGITDAFIAGADRAVISTKTISSKEGIKNSIDLSDKLILSIDYKDKIISPSKEIRDMGVKGITQFCLDEGIDVIVFTDLSDNKFQRRYLQLLPSGDYDLFVGGISHKRADALSHPNLKGLILDLKEAIRYQKN